MAAFLCFACLSNSCTNGTNVKSKEEKMRQVRVHDSLVDAEVMADANRALFVVDSLDAAQTDEGELIAYFRALVYNKKGDKKKTEEWCRKALANDVLKDEHPEFFYKVCDLLCTTMTYRDAHEGAMKVAQRGLDVAKTDMSEEGRHWMAVLLHDVGYCEMQLGRIDEAEKCFSQAYIALKQTAAVGQKYVNLHTLARVSYNIVDAYTSTEQYDKASEWIESADDAVELLAESPECTREMKEDFMGGLAIQRAMVLVSTGHRAEADAAYNEAMKLSYADTDLGIIERAGYLKKAERWGDLAALQSRVDSLSKAWGTPMAQKSHEQSSSKGKEG